MLQRILGVSGLKVSRLCFGTLPLGPLQKNFQPDAAAALLLEAYCRGISFFDTAELYDTYSLLRPALRQAPEMVIASRSYAVSGAAMAASIEKARHELDRDYIDIFGLHEIESGATLRGHAGALEYLQKAKALGLIKAIAVSTHTVAGVRAAAAEPAIDIIHPLLNREGMGIKDGTAAEMIAALTTAREFGKGVYAMKILGGGHLGGTARAAFRFINELDCVDAVAVGMQSGAEILLNLALIAGEEAPPGLAEKVAATTRSLMVASWCSGCGQCVSKCSFQALQLENGRVQVDREHCLQCGYCARACPDFCLKIY